MSNKTPKQKIKKAVALSYTEDMVAPNNIPVYEDSKVATILTELDLGNTIPPELYEAVAKILIFVGDMDDLYAKTKGYHK